ncbi:hypothetical protein H1R20_g13570, partial [Candolleomyces eurysporus]
MAPRNIIFFGESGHGKSSVINMVLGHDAARTSSSTNGCTFESTSYSHHLSGHDLVLWDTAGLNEGDQGTVTPMSAVKRLYNLLKSLEDGVSLLVFCIRAPRINDAAHKNWLLFHEIICQRRVPIVMAITHLENEDCMDDWWTENENRFRGQINLPPRNIVFFGESGHGKSSVINLILGEDIAPTSTSAAGCTPKCTPYPHQLSGQDLILWDTCGLNEGKHGTVTDINALKTLYSLLKSFEEGVSLLIFCIRGSRINDLAQQNWDLFRNIVCQGKVPTVIAITHLEDEDPMDDWWTQNKAMFFEYGIKPSTEHGSGVACITAYRGRFKNGRYRYQDEYEESKTEIRNLIVQNYLRDPWKVDQIEWFKTIVTTSIKTDWCCRTSKIEHKHLVSARGIYELMIRFGITEPEAAKVAQGLEKNSETHGAPQK